VKAKLSKTLSIFRWRWCWIEFL